MLNDIFPVAESDCGAIVNLIWPLPCPKTVPGGMLGISMVGSFINTGTISGACCTPTNNSPPIATNATATIIINIILSISFPPLEL